MAVLDGTAYSPGQPWKHGDQEIRTLSDLPGSWVALKASRWSNRPTPRVPRLARKSCANCWPGISPCVVLLDELVVYIRQFVESQALSGGIQQHLVHPVADKRRKLVPNTVVLASCRFRQ